MGGPGEGRRARAAVLAVLAVCVSGMLAAGAAARGDVGGGRGTMQDERVAERLRMVERQIVARGVRDPRVLEAMRTVPRHAFVPADLQRDAYGDFPLPIGEGQTISQPYIVALMTEALRVGPGDRVLELGTGSGYQAAVLAAIVDTVYTIEYVPALATRAAAVLDGLGCRNVVVKAGDGWGGWPEHAPFAAAIVTFAAPEPPPAVVAQLAVGGRLCIPIGPPRGAQELMLYVKEEDGSLSSRRLGAVRFVPVQGEGAR